MFRSLKLAETTLPHPGQQGRLPADDTTPVIVRPLDRNGSMGVADKRVW